jgi:hypothetical protein
MDEQKQSYTLLIIVIIAIVAIAAGVLWYSLRGPSEDFDFDSATTTPRDEQGRTPSAQSESITIYIPRKDERVGSPLVIQGEAKIYEGTVHTVNFRLLNAEGKELSVGYATSDSLNFGQFGSFRGELNFVSEIDQQGTLEIYRLVKEDNSEIDKIILPVMITKTPEFIKG